MAEQPIKASTPAWQQPSSKDLQRVRAEQGPAKPASGLDVSALNQELLDHLRRPTSQDQAGAASLDGALTPSPSGLADELSVLGTSLNGDTQQLIRDRERDALLNRGLRHLSNAMLSNGK
jgi:hypothetical protein